MFIQEGLVRDSLNVKCKRAGVILYTEYLDNIFTCFARDCDSHELSDFGGKVEVDEFAVDAALRELQEESLEVFSFSKEEIGDSFCVYSQDAMIIFIRIVQDPNMICSEFNKRIKDHKEKLEVCGVVWISLYDLISCLRIPARNKKSGLIFHRVERLLRRVESLHLKL